MGRLVITHSTYIDGLLKWLKILSKNERIQTITPAVITKVKGKSDKLKISITRKTKGGYKLKAMKGSSLQEIYIISDLTQKDLSDIIEDSRP